MSTFFNAFAEAARRLKINRFAIICGFFAAGSFFQAHAAPKVVLISLDGAAPRFINQFLADGTLSREQGIGLLKSHGTYALKNVTATPSLTAVSHIAIATGSTSSRNDIGANTFSLVASPFLKTISGFSAPIGGYNIDGPAPKSNPSAEPLWVALRKAGKKVVCATFPGADGLTVTVPGLTPPPVVQSPESRTVDYTIPYGESSGVFEQAFALTASDFGPAPQTTINQLTEAGVKFYQAKQKSTPLESFYLSDYTGSIKVNYSLQVVALDTTNSGAFDTLVFFDSTNGIKPGPFKLPSTGPAYVKASEKRSSRFYFEGSPRKSGTGFYVSFLAPDLSLVHVARYSITNIPRNASAAILANVDDINNNVGSWGNQPDYYFTERLIPSAAMFSDQELEEIWEDQVSSWSEYQGSVGLRAIEKNPEADLVMIYSEQPDGSEHQFLLTDPRQATNPTEPTTIKSNQDRNKIARYASYVRSAYQAADRIVQRVINQVGKEADGRPKSNIIVVSDHGFEIFHTTVLINNLLAGAGIDLTQAKAVTSGPAANVYINLKGREPNGTVSPSDYIDLQKKILSILRNARDVNPNYVNDAAGFPLFDKVYGRPLAANPSDPKFGRRVSPHVGQDFGDIFAILNVGYNFDGAQSPLVARLGDPQSTAPSLTLPSFYGAHGYNSELSNLSASFFAAGPNIRPSSSPIDELHNIDIAPTIERILGVTPSSLVQGKALHLGPAPLQLIGAASRKVHGSAGIFEIPLSTDGKVTIEDRRPDLLRGHTIVFTFSNPLVAGRVDVHGSCATSFSEIRNNQLIAHLWNVRNGQTVRLDLAGVSDGRSILTPIELNIGFLFGAVTGSNSVGATDLTEVRNNVFDNGEVNSESFRADILLNGKVNQSDLLFTELNLGRKLEP